MDSMGEGVVKNNEGEVKNLQLSEALKKLYLKLWILVAFCIVGWIIIVVSIKTNMFIVILGALVIGAPSLLDMKKYGFKSMFNYEYYIETTYSDGRKTLELDGTTTLMVLFFKWFFLIIAGVLITPIRYIYFTIKYEMSKKKQGIKFNIKNTFLLPSGVGIIAFVVGIILISII